MSPHDVAGVGFTHTPPVDDGMKMMKVVAVEEEEDMTSSDSESSSYPIAKDGTYYLKVGLGIFFLFKPKFSFFLQ